MDESIHGPWLQTALLLDRQALPNGDQAALLMRMQPPIQLEADILLPHRVRMVVLLCWIVGETVGSATVTLGVCDPLARYRQQHSFSLELRGDPDTRLVAARRLTLDIDVPGVWWIDVRLGEDLVTRMPFRVHYPTVH